MEKKKYAKLFSGSWNMIEKERFVNAIKSSAVHVHFVVSAPIGCWLGLIVKLSNWTEKSRTVHNAMCQIGLDWSQNGQKWSETALNGLR
jgi:hypothetical protein